MSPAVSVRGGVIINDVSEYIKLLVRIAHIICNHPTFLVPLHLKL